VCEDEEETLTATFGFNLCWLEKRRWLPHKKSAFARGRAVVEFCVIFVALGSGADLP
jgi:hypothetical protein